MLILIMHIIKSIYTSIGRQIRLLVIIAGRGAVKKSLKTHVHTALEIFE